MKIIKRIVISFLLIVILAITGFILFARYGNATPVPEGQYKVGITSFDIGLTGQNDGRIPVIAWYPTDSVTGVKDFYIDKDLAKSLSDMSGVPAILLPTRESSSIVNANAVQEKFPVIVYNHGYAGFQKQNATLLENLASHGYVVISIGHPHDSLIIKFNDGTIVLQNRDTDEWRMFTEGWTDPDATARILEPLLLKASSAKDPAALRKVMDELSSQRRLYLCTNRAYRQWSDHTKTVLDSLDKVNSGKIVSPLKGVIDTSKIGIFGHSLGGMVAGRFSMIDKRIKAGINLDGAQLALPLDKVYKLNSPFCFFYADTTMMGTIPITNEGMNDALLNNAPAGSCSVRIRQTTHLTFTDMNNSAMIRLSGAVGKINPDKMNILLRGMLTGFFNHHLKYEKLTGFDSSEMVKIKWSDSVKK